MRYKISPVGSLDQSQSTRVTDRQTDGENYDSQDRASIAASCGKNFSQVVKMAVVAAAPSSGHHPTFFQ